MALTHITAAALAGLVLVGTSAATAGSGGHHDGVRTALRGYAEVPAISSDTTGRFRAFIGDDEINYRLEYGNFTSPVQQAHIHFGQVAVNGGISVFLCTNLGNGPTGTPACPESGEVTGTLTPASVVGPAAQGIAPGEFEELAAAIHAGVAYVNVHTATFPGGEIRGQLRRHH
jgi:hypothetical protein